VGRRGRRRDGLALKLRNIGLERDNFVRSHGNHGRVLLVVGLESIYTRLELVVPIPLLYILLLLLLLVSFKLFIFSSQGSYFLGMRLKLALNGI